MQQKIKPKIIILGNSPLPSDNSNSRPAAGLRTYQFIKALETANFEYKLITISIDKNCKKYNNTHTIIEKDDTKITSKLQSEITKYNPDIIIGINTYPSYLACKIKTKAAIWSDLNGWIMAEAQAQAYKSNSNDFLNHYFEIEKTIIKRTDKISTVSKNQKTAILGELATYGRLNKDTFNYEFAHKIENSTTWFKDEKQEYKKETNASKKINEENFNILWIGGYNTWADTDTLFKGIENAILKEKNIKYISTGGEITGLDDITFKSFKDKINKSKVKDNFVFLGWVKTEEIPSIYKKGSIGINVDKNCIETKTGARNRLNEMMKYSLPIITTKGSEIANDVKKYNTGLVVQSGNENELTEAILEMYKNWKENKQEFKDFGKNGKKYCEEIMTYENTCKPLIKWLKTFKESKKLHAPDFEKDTKINNKYSLNTIKNYIKKNGFKKTIKKIIQRINKF